MAAPASARSPSPWLHGRAPDLLLGAGLGYLLSVPLLLALGDAQWPLGVVLLAGLVINTQHYGATLLRVYDDPEDRRRYAFFSIGVSLALLAVLLIAFRVSLLAAFLVSLYFTWSPWHFAGQNYGLALTFLRRRGVAVEGLAKRVLYASFLLSFALTFIGLHTADSQHVFAQGALGADTSPTRMLRLGIPSAWARLLVPAAVLLYLLSLGALAAIFRRAGVPARALLAPALLVITQALWYSVPAGFAFVGSRPDLIPFSWLYISLTHSVQYLWVTTYYARRADAGERMGGYLAKTLLAGSLIQVLPALLAPLVLSPMEWRGGLALLIFSVVNLHHFALDGAIWKLRDGRVARLLLRPAAAPGAATPAARRGCRVSPARALVYAVGVACAAVPVLELAGGRVLAVPSLPRLERARGGLAVLRRDDPDVLRLLGDFYIDAGRPADAAGAYRRALEIRRRNRPLRNNLAWALAVDPAADAAAAREAVALAEEALGLGAPDASLLDTLAAAYAAAGRFDAALATAGRGLALAESRGEAEVARGLRARLDLYRRGVPYREGAPRSEGAARGPP